jgi:phosphoribosylformylglycinamidine synthase subunit PurSL
MLSLQGLRFLASDDKQALELSKRLGTGLSGVEVREVRAYYKKRGREPSDIELQTIGQSWSEHCFHKVFKSPIQLGKNTIKGIFKSYIARATEEINANWVISSFVDNAGIVKFEETYSIAAKVETHNHPSAIDPFGGAATGVGGVIRDILGVWAEPIASTDVLCFGNLDFPFGQLPRGAKHPKYLLKGVVSGIGNYGNNVGVPTVNGALCFDPSFAGYALVFCGCFGLLKNRNYIRSAKPGDILVIAGARTGAEGIHGVNFASEGLDSRVEEMRPAVQIPDPIMEEKIKRAVLEIADRHLASAITDLGGGGLSSAVCETAHSRGCGADVDLASIPLKTQSILPWEIWVSETQERMLLVVPEATLAKVLSVFEREEIEAGAFGKLLPGSELSLRKRDEKLGKIDLNFLFNPPLPKLEARVAQPSKSARQREATFSDLSNDLLNLLRQPNIASKEALVRTYDFEVQGNTVLKPFQYPYPGPNDAAVLKPLANSERGIAISCGLNPKLGVIDPYWMAASAIDEAIRNNIAVGGRRISLLDNFAWGNPEHPENLGSLIRSAEACYDIAKGFETPFISGKDSLYNETPLGDIAPTLLITALGIIPEISRCVSADFKEVGDSIYLIGQTRLELAGSEYHRLKKIRDGHVPKLDVREASGLYKMMNRVLDQTYIRACHDLSDGGLGVAIAEMSIGNALGADVKLPLLSSADEKRQMSPSEVLFSESNARFLVEIQRGEEDKFEKMMKGFPFSRIGSVLKGKVSIRNHDGRRLLELPIVDCFRAWRSTFS